MCHHLPKEIKTEYLAPLFIFIIETTLRGRLGGEGIWGQVYQGVSRLSGEVNVALKLHFEAPAPQPTASSHRE